MLCVARCIRQTSANQQSRAITYAGQGFRARKSSKGTVCCFSLIQWRVAWGIRNSRDSSPFCLDTHGIEPFRFRSVLLCGVDSITINRFLELGNDRVHSQEGKDKVVVFGVAISRVISQAMGHKKRTAIHGRRMRDPFGQQALRESLYFACKHASSSSIVRETQEIGENKIRLLLLSKFDGSRDCIRQQEVVIIEDVYVCARSSGYPSIHCRTQCRSGNPYVDKVRCRDYLM